MRKRKTIFREGIAPAIIRFTIGFIIFVVLVGILYFLVVTTPYSVAVSYTHLGGAGAG